MAIERSRWEQLAARIRARWPGQLSNVRSDAYFEALSDLEAGTLDRGVDRLIASEQERVPTPDEIRAAALASEQAPEADAGTEPTGPADRQSEVRSWLAAGLVAIVVAGVIVLVFVLAFGDDEAEPAPFEPASIQSRLLDWDWDSDALEAASVTCAPEEEGRIDCAVLFTTGNEVSVSVTEGIGAGEIVVDVPEDAQPQEQERPEPEGGTQTAP